MVSDTTIIVYLLQDFFDRVILVKEKKKNQQKPSKYNKILIFVKFDKKISKCNTTAKVSFALKHDSIFERVIKKKMLNLLILVGGYAHVNSEKSVIRDTISGPRRLLSWATKIDRVWFTCATLMSTTFTTQKGERKKKEKKKKKEANVVCAYSAR